MQNLTPQGQQLVSGLCNRYNLSHDAVMHMLIAVNNGGCTMAQFNCPELGGGGQWMQGGMTMVGDMFNHGLKMTVDNLCSELANGLASMQVFVPIPKGAPNSLEWWPGDLGQPFSSGAQNNIRYAVFPNRLAVQLNGNVTVYDTLDHSIGGVSQQQGGDTSLSFSSQYGTISVSSLPIVSGGGIAPQDPVPQNNFAEPPALSDHVFTEPAPLDQATLTDNVSASSNSSVNDVLEIIGQLASLRDVGALSEEEFNNKKVELLSRI